MDYKTIIKSQRIRFIILRFLSWLPDSIMLRLQYKLKLGRWPNLKRPERFTEWLQWYKINYRNPVIWECVDKYAVRKFIEEKGLSDILNELLGVYNDANEIEFDNLPNQFVIKTTNGGGGENIIICKDKSSLDINSTIQKLNKWLTLKSIDAGREWAYTGISKPKIIIERFLENPQSPEAGIEDYKILCFHGVPKIIIVDCDRYIGHKRNFYDTSWKQLFVTSDCPSKNENICPPANLHEMLDYARILSSDFPFVRVDLYNINGKIIFGELTYYPWSGYVSFNPDTFDYELGTFFNSANLQCQNC